MPSTQATLYHSALKTVLYVQNKVRTLRVRELQDLLRLEGLNCYGLKADLQARLEARINTLAERKTADAKKHLCRIGVRHARAGPHLWLGVSAYVVSWRACTTLQIHICD